MEHTLSPLDLGRPWRTTALVASAVALLELMLLLIVGFALFADTLASDARTATAPKPALPAFAAKPKPRTAEPKPVAKTLPTLPRDETSVLVLNGNGRAGAAGEVGSLVHARGYIVARVGNAARSDYGKSVVMYRPGRKAEARRLAREVGVKVVGPLDGIRLDELMGAHVVVVIGAQ